VYGQLLVGDGAGGYRLLATSSLGIAGGVGLPGGVDGEIQFNNGGVLGGAPTLYFDDATGRLGIGTTSPYAALSVVGDVVARSFTATSSSATSTFTNVSITGRVADTTGSAGTSGYVLQTTGSGVQWVATSSLGIVGGGGSSAGQSFEISNGYLAPTTTQTIRANGGVLSQASSTFIGGVTIDRSTTTNATSTTLAVTGTASSSNAVVSNSLTIGTLSGFLKATAGVVSTALVNLTSDITGILGISNGGTGTSTAPSYGQLLVGNSGGGYDYRATSTLGVALSDTSGTLTETRGGTNQTSYATGDLLYASGANTLTKLPVGAPGTVLKVAGGVPVWGTDLTSGGGGGAGAWSTSTNDIFLYPTDTTDVVVVGSNATATLASIFEVSGKSYFSNNVGIATTSPFEKLSVQGNAYIAGNVTATGTLAVTGISTLASGFLSLASSTINGNLVVVGNATTTNATTTNLAITGLASTLLKTTAGGAVVAAIAGTDYLTSANLFGKSFEIDSQGYLAPTTTRTILAT
jgi:hypothetical protein